MFSQHGAPNRLADRLGVGGIVAVAIAVGPHILCRRQTHDAAEKRRLLAPEKISPSAVNVEVRPMAAVFSQTAKIDADAVPGKSVSLGDDYYDAARRRRS